ncbi:hypothetical protein CN639_28805 [Bacillus toyonensis]|uniref:Uncharacterized protein n=3 Tax=Bacillus toyonensis TaxID=155322 RepID=A0AB36TBB2_9BACI|nr:hypothetical protein CON55_15265 [Bacillus toyonensis]PEM80922.1 hypothetical protein CN639_28805 [Bacillus toyonensis]PEN69894.1 hypothetical protein CN545_13595 [Bacillus toyonensis]PEN91987.1 hypothetical protein CN551_02645 [Bacillus toyonensis]PGD50940.1 hypothetical protein COM38_20495 [Bacillus toyonensis]
MIQRFLIVHYGCVGDTGEMYEIKVPLSQCAEIEMKKLADGYKELDEEELKEFVLQYVYKDDQLEDALEKRQEIQEIMDEALGWTGNGYCDGGDIGSGTINIYTFVVDINKVLQTTINELENHHLLDGVKIAYMSDDEEYMQIYPNKGEFNLL